MGVDPEKPEWKKPSGSAAPTSRIVRRALEKLRSRFDAEAAAPPLDKPLVLVVEDNEDVSRLLVECLSREYRCERALDGEEGLARTIALKPDLVISDVAMPRKTGAEMLREMRANPALDNIPVIVLTAKADDDLRLRMLQDGAQDYLSKPFSTVELRARVRHLVSTKRARDVLQQELEGRFDDLATLATEITRRKRELQTALDAVRVARDHAEHASRLKSDFLTLVSHELRTPLSVVLLQLQVFQGPGEPNLSERQRKALRRISTSAVRLEALISSLLDFARIESGRIVTHAEAVNLQSLAAGVVAELQPIAEQKQLALRLSGSALPSLESDPVLLRTVIVNLVGNALKFTEKGSVEVELGQRDGLAEIRVTDTGPGIPEEDHAVIFQPFEQLGSIETHGAPGLGLGLAIVKDLVTALGGRIEVRSTLGAGTTFTVTLPAKVARRPESSRIQLPAS